MALFLIALLAGVLTVISPCVLPLLPIIVGGSLAGGRSIRRILTVTLSLGASVFLFTLLLKVSTAFINVPAAFWSIFSGGLIIIIGLILLFPRLWDKVPFVAKMNLRSNKAMSAGFKKQTFLGDVIVGASLGPVFASCSPTFFILLATVLPVSISAGIADILAYIAGLCFSLIVVSFVGQTIMAKLGIASDPNGWFKRGIGILFIVVGIAIITGFDKILEQPLYSVFDETKIETKLLQKQVAPGTSITNPLVPDTNGQSTTTSTAMHEGTSTAATGAVTPATAQTLARKASMYHKAPELVQPDAYLNTGGQPISLAQYRGKDVVLVDFWTYSCINCLRTLPYLTSWYAKYKDQGFVIIGVHTPEFAFEHVQSNVAAALVKLGVTYPVVLDNEYKTWNAYGNQFWPHEYVIDIDGYITHDHIGEGEYDVTEKAIQAALAERASRLGTSASAIPTSLTTVADPNLSAVQSPETYFGYNRNQNLANGTPSKAGTSTFTLPSGAIAPNKLYLGGSWNIEAESAVTNASGTSIEYSYTAHDVDFVASASTPVTVEVFRDGVPVGNFAGADVDPKTSTATINANRLYTLVHDTSPGQHTILIKIMGAGLHAYTFTFG
ncbi:redoxin family protein [Patescibacteria group bacterium]|nr:redoxin family protein [Patescibacteria group bacterium]